MPSERQVRFDLMSLAPAQNSASAQREQRTPLVQQQQERSVTINAGWINKLSKLSFPSPLYKLPTKLRHGKMGGCTPYFRASWVRAAFFKLAITGVIAGLAALVTSDEKAARSCVYAAAVNFVACMHYMRIWSIRLQSMPDGYEAFASGHDQEGDWEGRTESDEASKVFVQELQVDSLRHSDWVVTLWVMVLDLYSLAAQASGDKEPALNLYVAMAIIPFTVLFGVAYRFYANELRPEEAKGVLSWPQVRLGFASFILGCVAMGVVIWGITSPLIGNDDITDDARKADRDAVYVLTFAWLGYPVVSILSWFMLRGVPGNEYDATVSWFKDACYAALDVLSKGGLALFVALRTRGR